MKIIGELESAIQRTVGVHEAGPLGIQAELEPQSEQVLTFDWLVH